MIVGPAQIQTHLTGTTEVQEALDLVTGGDDDGIPHLLIAFLFVGIPDGFVVAGVDFESAACRVPTGIHRGQMPEVGAQQVAEWFYWQKSTMRHNFRQFGRLRAKVS
jgi:hypothetical protein